MEIKPAIETFAKIKVVGVGGGGNSAVNRMISAGIKGVDFITVNTDAQALHHSSAPHKVHIGHDTTRGLGAGMDPVKGKQSAEENIDQIKDSLKGADMVFVTCGMGGGTGTGASPVIAQAARELGSLTVGVVTLPFSFEGAQRMSIAQSGVKDLMDTVDTIITIPNDRLLKIIDKKVSLLDGFNVVDNVLSQGVQGISEIITVPGLINVDFADVKAIMNEAGSALMGIGQASGADRSLVAAKLAVESPLLDMSIEGAKGVLFTITGSCDLSMDEVNEAARLITASTDDNAKIIFGAVIDESLDDEVKISVIATGFGSTPSRRSTREQNVDEQPTFTRTSKSIFEEQDRDDDDDVPPPAQSSDEEDELEIPAFIRKKLKS